MTRGICLCPGFSVRFDARRLCTKRRLSTPPSAFRKEWLVEIWTGVAGWAWCRAALFRSDFGRSMLSTCFGRPHRRSQGKWLGGFGHPLTRATTTRFRLCLTWQYRARRTERRHKHLPCNALLICERLDARQKKF